MFPHQLQRLIPRKLHPILGDVYNRSRGYLQRLISRGNEVTCPCCKHRFRRFLAHGHPYPILAEMQMVGGGYRLNAECAWCGSLERERLVYLFLEQRALLHAGMKLLHIAPEKSLQKLLQQQSTDYYSADLNSPLARLTMDITKIDFPNGYFDAIICNHVLEHIPDDLQAMRELYRVLKPGGWAILQVPYSPILEQTLEDPSVTSARDRIRVFGQRDHVRIYGLDYGHRLEQAGFTLTREMPDQETISRYGLDTREPVWFVRK